jgi:hypothetical protein
VTGDGAVPAPEVLVRLYGAFAACDGAGMAACYDPAARFSDPVYPELRGPEVGAMWRMLTGRARDLSIEVESITGDDSHGAAAWVARYSFGPDARPVTNRVRSTFDLAHGLILSQRDTFDLHTWSAMALGPKGRLLGWTPIVRNAVRRQADAGLREFMAKEGTGPVAG